MESGTTVATIVDPPRCCPGCVAEAGQGWPAHATSEHCARCLDRIRRVWQISRWNRDHDHQVMAGRASWTAFSARWRASSGLPPLSADAAWRYVTPEMVRGPLGTVLPDALRQVIYQAWCAGVLLGVEAWLSDNPPPDPQGLWTARGGGIHDAHDRYSCRPPGR